MHTEIIDRWIQIANWLWNPSKKTNSIMPAEPARSVRIGRFNGHMTQEPQFYLATVMCNKHSWALPLELTTWLLLSLLWQCTGVTWDGTGLKGKLFESWYHHLLKKVKWSLSYKLIVRFSGLMSMKALCNLSCMTQTGRVTVLTERCVPPPAALAQGVNVWEALRFSDVITKYKLYN